LYSIFAIIKKNPAQRGFYLIGKPPLSYATITASYAVNINLSKNACVRG
jgi:hypothetical protein